MLIITYDEHGGFFDHVVPPVAEVLQDPRRVLDSHSIGTVTGGAGVGVIGDAGVLDANPGAPAASGYRPNEKIIYGLRVPTFVVSPWVRKGAVIKRMLDHTSILKTILIRFCAPDRPFMSDRVHHAFDLGTALARRKPRNVTAQPRVLPELPDLRAFALAKPFRIIRKREITGENSDFHDFMEVLSRIVSP
jgi:phospholipase C